LLERFGLAPLAAMLRLAPARLPKRDRSGAAAASGKLGVQPHRRVALLSGCVASVLAPQINAAAARLLARSGIEVVPVPGEGCCGALVHHLGREAEARAQARANVAAWMRIIETGGLDAILITASGCGTMIKDYGFLFRDEPAIAEQAARVSALARDISEYLAALPLQPSQALPLTVAYHGACSLQHGQKITREPKKLLSDMGFRVRDIPEGHLCCGSAGTYNMLQPDLARRLRERKVGNIERVAPDVIAAGNVGCIAQIEAGTAIPVLHPVELVDWACGGPRPAALGNVQTKLSTTLATDAVK
jgi:glycolate oxidase iron-sulfur subunit